MKSQFIIIDPVYHGIAGACSVLLPGAHLLPVVKTPLSQQHLQGGGLETCLECLGYTKGESSGWDFLAQQTGFGMTESQVFRCFFISAIEVKP